MCGRLSRLSSRQFSADSDLVLCGTSASPQSIVTYASQYPSARRYKPTRPPFLARGLLLARRLRLGTDAKTGIGNRGSRSGLHAQRNVNELVSGLAATSGHEPNA